MIGSLTGSVGFSEIVNVKITTGEGRYYSVVT